MALLKTNAAFEMDFVESKINDILKLFINLHTQIFVEEINY